MTKIQVLGIGSPYGNDQVGWYVAEQLQQAPALAPWLNERLTIMTLDRPGVTLLDYFAAGDHLILVDAMLGQGALGTIKQFDWHSLPSWDTPTMSTHAMGLADTVQLADALGALPERLFIYGIEIERCETDGGLDPRLKTAAQQLVTRITQAVIIACA
jgi:hydrogenase maturation protease